MNNKEHIDHTRIKKFYDKIYYKDSSEKLIISQHLKKLAINCHLKADDKVLDIGCGKGNWLLACSKFGIEPFGIDLSDKAISICKANMPEDNFFAQPAESLPFPDNKFNLVTCLGSLEHFVDQLGSLQEMVRVAKSDASFIILVPNKNFLTRKLGLYSGTYQTDAREIVRTPEEWENLFRQAGLEVSKKRKDLHVLSWEWITLDKWYTVPVRSIQAILLALWPLKWQYQIYYFCKKNNA